MRCDSIQDSSKGFGKFVRRHWQPAMTAANSLQFQQIRFTCVLVVANTLLYNNVNVYGNRLPAGGGLNFIFFKF